MTRPALVDLTDLSSRQGWNPHHITALVEALGLVLDPAESWHSFAPPRVLIVVVPYRSAELLSFSRPWLADAERLIVVRDDRGEQYDDDTTFAAAWHAVRRALRIDEIVYWSADIAPVRAAIDRAIAACANIAADEPVAHASEIQLPPSSWIECAGPGAAWMHAVIVRGLRRCGDRITLCVDHDLAALPETVTLTEPRVAFVRGRWGPRGNVFVGRDPNHPIAWRADPGKLMWSYGTEEIGFLTVFDHEDPCEPQRTYPRHVAMSPRADICAATFETDVLVTEAVPIRWTRAGSIDVAAWPRDPRRAIFFTQSETSASADLRHALDRAHELDDEPPPAPNVVLGPDARARYAVDLRRRVVRISGGPTPQATHVGGPEDGYAVFDADHALVRRGTGRLCGGWFRWATIDDGGAYWREDLGTGERIPLGSSAPIKCVDPAAEAVALDAAREGRHVAVDALRANHVRIEGDLSYIGIPGTRSVIALAARHLRVI